MGGGSRTRGKNKVKEGELGVPSRLGAVQGRGGAGPKEGTKARREQWGFQVH